MGDGNSVNLTNNIAHYSLLTGPGVSPAGRPVINGKGDVMTSSAGALHKVYHVSIILEINP
jgi:hypothetical protein